MGNENSEILTKDKVYYKGLQVRAPPGVHEAVLNVVLQYVDRQGHILEVGSGAGSLTQRLLDNRLHVTASGIDADDFCCPDVQFQYLDIQASIPEEKKNNFQMIVATEVVEHLENIFLFFRNAFALLSPGGTMVLSTPNVMSVYSRFIFLKSGRVLLCNENLMDEWGHIQILPEWLLRKVGVNTGFEFLQSQGVGSLRFENLPLWHRLFQTIAVPASKLLLGENFPQGYSASNVLMVFRKPG